MKGLTPYQGRCQAAGLFECYECTNEWYSAYTWANTPQACLYCNMFVYPINQWELTRKKQERKKKQPNKEHLQRLCGRCRFQEKSCADV
jgi:hypothetical protein